MRTFGSPALAAILLVMLACDDIKEPDDTAPPEETQPTEDTEPPDDTGPDEVNPTIDSCTWQCAPSDSAPNQIVVMVRADDPQGDETLDPMGGTVATWLDEGHQAYSYTLLCDDEGDCSASFAASEASQEDCVNYAPPLTATAVVVDEDDNSSEPCTLTWIE